MTQLEENLTFRLARLEQQLEAYRKLHAEELEEIARGLAELRREVEAFLKASAPLRSVSPRREEDEGSIATSETVLPRAADVADCVYRPSLQRVKE